MFKVRVMTNLPKNEILGVIFHPKPKDTKAKYHQTINTRNEYNQKSEY